jgi:hypothetical protein
LRIYCIETSANRSQMIWRWPRQKTNIPSSFLFFRGRWRYPAQQGLVNKT